MREVSTQTVALVADGLMHRGIALAPLLEGLPFSEAELRDPSNRIDWEDWVELLERVERAIGGPHEMPRLFVPLAGVRTGYGFVRLANTFLSVEDLYRLFARWGLSRQLMVMRGRFAPRGKHAAELTVTIDPTRVGSCATLRFTTGVVTALPGLQGLPHAIVRARIEPHVAVYDITLPRARSLVSRARHALGVIGGARATLAELEAQSEEIVEKNAELQQQVASLRKAEASLRERDEWLQLALDAGKVGIWSWDRATRTARFSPSIHRLLGVPANAPADALLERVHPDDRPGLLAAFDAAILAGRPVEVEYRLAAAAGEVTWLRASGRATRSADGAVERVLGTVIDITERKQLDVRLRFADRLIAAGTLAAGVAHEINNPLAYVLGNVEYLGGRTSSLGAEAPVFEQALAEARDGVLRIRDIVRDLRTFARPQEEHVALIDLRSVADAARRIVAHEVRHRSRLEVVYPDAPVHVLGNESRVGQVLTNLLINAAQAMPARPAEESLIRLRVGRSPLGEALVEVEDNGAGIAPADLPRLFDPFFTTKALGEGTGLGLPVCQGIVHAMRGRIEVDTELGRGTTFRVVWPEANAGPAVAAPPETRAPLSGRRVLVVDDEPMVRRVVSRTLTSAGCEVVEADGGRAGLTRALSGEHFDAVLCDLMMPDLTGMDVFAALRDARPELARRVIFITGGAVTDRARAFLAQAENPCVEKPFEVARLLDVVARA